MRYLTIQEKTKDNFRIIPNTMGASRSCNAIFPHTEQGLEDLLVYATAFTDGIQQVTAGTASVYEFEGPEPVLLPFSQNLNYVDLINAEKLSLKDPKLLKWVKYFKQQDDPGLIINSDGEKQEKRIHALSSIIVSLNTPIIKSPDDDDIMERQVICTKTAHLFKVKDDIVQSWLEIHESNKNVHFNLNNDQEQVDGDDDEKDPADWWKEWITEIGKAIVENRYKPQ